MLHGITNNFSTVCFLLFSALRQSYFFDNTYNVILADVGPTECYPGEEVLYHNCVAIACARGDWSMYEDQHWSTTTGPTQYDASYWSNLGSGSIPAQQVNFGAYCDFFSYFCAPLTILRPAVWTWASGYLLNFLHELHYLCLLFTLLPQMALDKLNANHRRNSVDRNTRKEMKDLEEALCGDDGSSASSLSTNDNSDKGWCSWRPANEVLLLMMYFPGGAKTLLASSLYTKRMSGKVPWLCQAGAAGLDTVLKHLGKAMWKDTQKLRHLFTMLFVPPLIVLLWFYIEPTKYFD